MDAETLKALKGSIQKWQDIANGVLVDSGYENCSLCLMFMDESDGEDIYHCLGCPVNKDGNAIGCHGTPYSDWVDHQYEHAYYFYTNYLVVVKGCDECKRLALAELDFLKSLLPDEEK